GRMEFEVPVAHAGDNYDRYLVRMAEIEQSMRIVEQCLARMPEGPHQLSDQELIDGGLMADMGKVGKTADLWKAAAETDATLEGTGRGCHRQIEAPAPAYALPPKEEAYGSIEGLMRHFEIIMWGRGITPPPGEAYAAVEGGNGELGFHIVSDGKDRPYRVRVRPPCFFHMSAVPKLVTGGL